MELRKLISSIIKEEILKENFLMERLTEIDNDVDYIYDNYFKKDIEEIQRTNIVTIDMFKKSKLDTSYLMSKDASIANKENPCLININFGGINHYNPNEQIINLTINGNALSHVMNYKGNIELAKNELPERVQKRFKQEFTEEKLKGTINHELVHWIDDTLHNKHIQKTLEKAKETKGGIFRNKPISMNYLEIQAQIHNIKQAKRKHSENWDNLTFGDLLEIIPVLSIINNGLSFENREQWRKAIRRRMYREGLLGKKM